MIGSRPGAVRHERSLSQRKTVWHYKRKRQRPTTGFPGRATL